MTSEVNIEASFELSGPSYLLGPLTEAVIELIDSVEVSKSKCPAKKNLTDNCPIRLPAPPQ